MAWGGHLAGPRRAARPAWGQACAEGCLERRDRQGPGRRCRGLEEGGPWADQEVPGRQGCG
eukprot:15206895-Alexandrium_andersonii.AAC.1